MQGVLCERCKVNQATLHLTDIIEGSVFERHLCEECRSEELPFDLPSDSELHFHCRCGRVIRWRIPRDVCEHGTACYERSGRAEVEIATCECGIKFLAVASQWRCSVCGAEAVVHPREAGVRGYVHDHINRSMEGEEIQIRGILP